MVFSVEINFFWHLVCNYQGDLMKTSQKKFNSVFCNEDSNWCFSTTIIHYDFFKLKHPVLLGNFGLNWWVDIVLPLEFLRNLLGVILLSIVHNIKKTSWFSRTQRAKYMSVVHECVDEYFQSGMETIIFMYERPFSKLVNVVMNIDFFKMCFAYQCLTLTIYVLQNIF